VEPAPADPDQRSIAAEAAGRDLTRYCAADCDLNHAGTPHVPWDCNAPDGSPTFGEADRRVLAELDEARLPWVRYATPLLLSAGEIERLRSPITAAMLRLQVDEDARDLPAGERLSGQLRALDQRLISGQYDAQDASAPTCRPGWTVLMPTGSANCSATPLGAWTTTPAGVPPPILPTWSVPRTSPTSPASCAPGAPTC